VRRRRHTEAADIPGAAAHVAAQVLARAARGVPSPAELPITATVCRHTGGRATVLRAMVVGQER
jgi:hypothetical protein